MQNNEIEGTIYREKTREENERVVILLFCFSNDDYAFRLKIVSVHTKCFEKIIKKNFVKLSFNKDILHLWIGMIYNIKSIHFTI